MSLITSTSLGGASAHEGLDVDLVLGDHGDDAGGELLLPTVVGQGRLHAESLADSLYGYLRNEG
jgi:hypothetical protein